MIIIMKNKEKFSKKMNCGVLSSLAFFLGIYDWIDVNLRKGKQCILAS